MIRLAVRLRRAQAEAVLVELLELVPSGLEERELANGLVEYAIYGAAGELPLLPEVRATVGDALVELSTSEVPDDWPERWKEFHRPVLIEPPRPSPDRVGSVGQVPALHVRAPWMAPSERADALEIVIEPGQAFGTGSHASTRLCLELLLAHAALGARGPVLDVGSGSGVLAIAAAALGHGPVLALDNDLASVDATSSNAARNRTHLEVRNFDVRSEPLPRMAAPLVVANLLRPLLERLLSAFPEPPGHLIAGGLLVGEVDEIARTYTARLNLRERTRRREGDWTALWLSRQ
jgi:ribosomal protein L11 methyltransferase